MMEIALILVAFGIGWFAGSYIEGCRWRDNANDIKRIFSYAGLYKVSHADTWNVEKGWWDKKGDG